ncbi:MAG: hypothetical protein JWN84_2594 [Nocardioides sp.]|nr:hypothetical protein [Nocardioides sp.]
MPARDRYHHGDLRAALVTAGVAAARDGGEAAVSLTRLAGAVGVSPSAAYRHFAGGIDELLVAVGDVARRELADLVRRRVDAVTEGDHVGRFRASGAAYVEYVLTEHGIFEVACRHDRGRDPEADPFALLQERIDRLAEVGLLRDGVGRDEAAMTAWSAVHGLAVLLTEGPLQRLPAARRDALVDAALDTVERGLCVQV